MIIDSSDSRRAWWTEATGAASEQTRPAHSVVYRIDHWVIDPCAEIASLPNIGGDVTGDNAAHPR